MFSCLGPLVTWILTVCKPMAQIGVQVEPKSWASSCGVELPVRNAAKRLLGVVLRFQSQGFSSLALGDSTSPKPKKSCKKKWRTSEAMPPSLEILQCGLGHWELLLGLWARPGCFAEAQSMQRRISCRRLEAHAEATAILNMIPPSVLVICTRRNTVSHAAVCDPSF